MSGGGRRHWLEWETERSLVNVPHVIGPGLVEVSRWLIELVRDVWVVVLDTVAARW